MHMHNGVRNMQLNGKILIVDDEEINRGILDAIFQSSYEVLEAENGKEALELVEENLDSLKVILLDRIMPVMDGFELLKILNEKRYIKQIPVILITGDDTAEAEKMGYELGVSDLILKPFDYEIVTRRVQNIVDLYVHKNQLEKMVEEQTEKIQIQAQKLREVNENLLEALSTVVEFRDLESGEHIRHIKSFVKVLLTHMMEEGNRYNLNEEIIEQITKASALHDIGKVAIPDAILLKPGKLTPEEFEVMKTHTIKGCELLERLDIVSDDDFYKLSYEICRHHHEKWDGRGYPDGLAGDNIPISAQVVAVADIYDALVSKRVYKDSLGHENAIRMIKDGECGQFSEHLLHCLDLSKDEFWEIVKAR